MVVEEGSKSWGSTPTASGVPLDDEDVVVVVVLGRDGDRPEPAAAAVVDASKEAAVRLPSKIPRHKPVFVASAASK